MKHPVQSIYSTISHGYGALLKKNGYQNSCLVRSWPVGARQAVERWVIPLQQGWTPKGAHLEGKFLIKLLVIRSNDPSVFPKSVPPRYLYRETNGGRVPYFSCGKRPPECQMFYVFRSKKKKEKKSLPVTLHPRIEVDFQLNRISYFRLS